MQPEEKKSFFKKYKKEVIIVLLAILVFSLLVYFLFFNKKENQNTGTINNPGLPSFNFGNLLNIFNGNENNNNDNNVENTEEENKNEDLGSYYFEGLIKVWSRPVAGYGFYNKIYTYKYTDEESGEEKTATDTKTILQFVDSETGYIYEKDLWDPTSDPVQVTDKSYPNVVRAYFMNDKNGGKSKVFMQYADGETIKTVSATVPDYHGSTANLLNIATLPDNIKDISVSPDAKKIAYIVLKNKNTNGFQDAYTDWYYINDVNDTYGKRVYTAELPYWKLSVLDNGNIYAYTIDTSYDGNNLYKLNTSTSSALGSLSQIYGTHNGMSFLINNSSLLTSIFTTSGIKTYKTDSYTKGFTDSDLSTLNFNTLANKCAENDSKGENLIICSVPKEIENYEYGLPDAWYQGMTSWDDNLYVVNNQYPFGQLLFNIHADSIYGDIIDAKNLAINNLKTHLAFINKNDGSLWTLNITNILYVGSAE